MSEASSSRLVPCSVCGRTFAEDRISKHINVRSISASPTACPLRGYGRAGTQSDRLGEAVIWSTGTPMPARWTCRRRCRTIGIDSSIGHTTS